MLQDLIGFRGRHFPRRFVAEDLLPCAVGQLLFHQLVQDVDHGVQIRGRPKQVIASQQGTNGVSGGVPIVVRVWPWARRVSNEAVRQPAG